jgi:glucose dehydrogenase
MSWLRIAGSLTFVALALLATAPFSRPQPTDGAVADWPYSGGDAGGSRYSRLGQINRTNVARLQIAWTIVCAPSTSRPGPSFGRVGCRPAVRRHR